MDHAARGTESLKASDFPTAIKHYTRALLENPRAVDYYTKRATAYSRLKPADGGPDAASALRDAETALALALERGKRELILAAQIRRAVALFQQERYGDASFLFDIVAKKTGVEEKSNGKSEDKMASAMATMNADKSKKDNQEVAIWNMKAKSKLSKLEEGDEKRAVTVAEYPKIKILSEKELKKTLEAQLKGADGAGESTSNAEDKPKETPQQTKVPGMVEAPVNPPTSTSVESRVRHEWYQNSETVVITIYVKSVPKDRVVVDFQKRSFSIAFPLPSGSEFSFTLDPLCAPIDTSASTCSVKSTKVEVLLRKQHAGQKWAALEGSADNEEESVAIPQAALQDTQSEPTPVAPSYPTSSLSGPKDWDKVASSLTSKKEKEKSKAKKDPKDDKSSKDTAKEDAGDESDAESVDSEYGGDPVDSFFKKLYANADPDTRRAMMKSYYESEGTALSTNWSEVGKGKVEVKPPSD